MPVNLDKPQLWKADIARSVDQYNQWFLLFAPLTYRQTRVKVTEDVEAMLQRTDNLRQITPVELTNHPGILFALRMSTAPPIARDRLVGLAGVPKSLVETMEKDHSLPARMAKPKLLAELQKIAALVMRLSDVDIFPWLEAKREPTKEEVYRGATIVADRLCGAQADPIVRNAQEKRQLAEIKKWLESRGYSDVSGKASFDMMQPGTFAFRLNVVGLKEDHAPVNIPIDTVIMPIDPTKGNLPLLIEAKSAGDFTNVNKRRKEEATKVSQLRRKHGADVRFVLFLCGYFDSGYLGYEAAEGIDWVWEHRIDDLGIRTVNKDDEGIEETRLALQSALDAGKSQAERNRLGQFATPTDLATAVVIEAVALLPAKASIRFIDPAFGTGSFYSALLRLLPASQIKEATAYEVDPYFGLPAQSLWKGKQIKVEIGDFTASVPAKGPKANLVVCNPPYVRHHHIEKADKRRLQALVEQHFGYRLSGLTGLYCYFLLLSQLHMSQGGIGAWLIPSEFMDVNYGRQIKQFLLDQVTLLRIHRFDSSDVQFQDALVSSAVVLFQNSSPTTNHQVVFTYGSIGKPSISETIDRTSLRHVAKWTSLPQKRHHISVEPKATLSDFFAIKRGLATGCNSFFVLTPDQVAGLSLPKRFLRPILPSPRNLAVDEVPTKANGEPAIENPLFLLDCPLPESEVKANFPSLWSYLCQGIANEIQKGYLCRNRQPWYSQETRPAAPFLCTYMGRPTKRNLTPFRFILNESRATATNVYLMLYPKGKLKLAIEADYKFRQAVRQALSSIGPDMLTGEGRLYGGGLHKMEPKELANVPANVVFDLLPEAARPAAQRTLFPSNLDIESA